MSCDTPLVSVPFSSLVEGKVAGVKSCLWPRVRVSCACTCCSLVLSSFTQTQEQLKNSAAVLVLQRCLLRSNVALPAVDDVISCVCVWKANQFPNVYEEELTHPLVLYLIISTSGDFVFFTLKKLKWVHQTSAGSFWLSVVKTQLSMLLLVVCYIDLCDVSCWHFSLEIDESHITDSCLVSEGKGFSHFIKYCCSRNGSIDEFSSKKNYDLLTNF